MIAGQITLDREAILRIELEQHAASVAVDTVLDTGFTEYLTLPRALIAALGLPFLHWATMQLADGRPIALEVFEATVRWGETLLPVPVHAADGGPLLEMGMLDGCRVTLQVIAADRC